MDESIARAAEAYRTLGLQVVPVDGKRPLVPWRELVDRWLADDEFRALPWERATGLALVLGPATWRRFPGLWVLDVESAWVGEATAWLDATIPDWRQRVASRTGGGGLHVFLTSPDGRPVPTHPIRWGEVRGEACLVVLPPSIHPNGTRYGWLSCDWGRIAALDPGVVPDYARTADRTQPANDPLDVAEVLSGVELGRRNQTLFRLACKLRAADVPEAWAARLVSEAASRCDPPWGSGPGEEPPERMVARVYATYAPNPELVVSNGKGEHANLETTIPDSWRPVPVTQLASSEPAVSWVWEGFLARGYVTDFYGFWKSGKTTLTAGLLAQLGSGGELAGRRVTAGRALVVTEEPRNRWSERAGTFALGDWVDIVSRPFAKRPTQGEWLQFTSYLARLVEEKRYDLVVLDSLPNLWCVADENNASEVIAALLPLQSLATKGAAVLLIRHPRKSGGIEATAGRGSGAIAGFVDIIVEFRRFAPDRPEDTRRVLSVYSRYEPFEVVVQWCGDSSYETLGTPGEVERQQAEQQVLEALRAQADGASLDDVADATGLPRSSVNSILQRLLQRGTVNRIGQGRRGAPYRWYLVDDASGQGFVSSHIGNGLDESKPNSNSSKNSSTIENGLDESKPNSNSSKNSSMDESGRILGRIETRDGFHSSKPHSIWDETKPGPVTHQAAPLADGPPVHAGGGDAAPVGEHAGDATPPASSTSVQPDPHAGGPAAHQPGGPWTSRQVLEVLAWCERLLERLERGDTVLGSVEYRPGHVVTDHPAFLRTNLLEAEQGSALAVARLVSYRRAVEASRRPVERETFQSSGC